MAYSSDISHGGEGGPKFGAFLFPEHPKKHEAFGMSWFNGYIMLGIPAHLEEQIISTIQGLGYTYVGAEFFSSSVPLLRIYVEGPAQTAIGLDEITVISRQLNALFDVEPALKGRYRVEVSSPGLDRRLFSIEDFQRFAGQEAKVKLHRPVEGQRNWVGIIKEVAQNNVVLEVGGVAHTFAFDTIDKAHLVPKLKW